MFIPRPAAISIDFISAAAILGAFANILPPLAGLAGLVWYGIQIYESKTVQKWIKVHRFRVRARRLAVAKADVKLAQGAIDAHPPNQPG